MADGRTAVFFFFFGFFNLEVSCCAKQNIAAVAAENHNHPEEKHF